MTSAEFRALAEFRYRIRIYLNGSEQAARNAGLEPQQYLLLLALRGLPASDREASIRDLPSACSFATTASSNWWIVSNDRSLLRRERSRSDRRQVIVHLTPRGEKILTRLAKQRIAELRTAAPALVRALTALIRSTQGKKSRRGRSA